MCLYFTKPVPRPAIWGGTKLADYFGYQDMPGTIGQAWAFSCQQGDESELVNFPGTLGDLWRNQPNLFKSRYQAFPYIISLIAPVSDLSIQIHPGDEIARRSGFASGKNEAWAFMQAPDSGEIIYGQKTADESELRRKISADQWDDIMGHLPVKKDDFVYIPAGTLHALRGGAVAYEVQQATDVTYRFYDYHRKDAQGNERPLHVDQAVECVDFSVKPGNAAPHAQRISTPDADITTYIQNDSFCIRKLVIHGRQMLRFPGYQLVSVVDGSGIADGQDVKRGDNFLLPADETLTLVGNVTLMTTCE